MKAYFEDLAWYDYLICLVYNGIFSYMLYKIGEVFLGIQHRTLMFFVAAFQIYFFLTMADSFWGLFPVQPEANWFAMMVSSGEYPQDANVNLMVVYYLSLFLSIICLNTPIIYIFLCILMYLIAAMILMQGWKMFDPHFSSSAESTASLLFLIWPAPVLFMTAPLQTGFIILGFAFFFRGWVKFITKGTFTNLLTGAVVMIAMQFESLYWVIPAVALTWLYKRPISIWIKTGITAVGAVALYVVMSQFILDTPITPASLAAMRNESIVLADVYGYGNVYWTTYAEMAKDYPFIILQFLFAPLPVFMQFDLQSAIIPAADAIFFVVIFMLAVISIISKWRAFLPVTLLFIFYTIFTGGAEDNWLHAIAMRMPVVMLCIMLAAGKIDTWRMGKQPAEHTPVL